MKTSSTRAIVLRRTNYGEADRILHLLTPVGRVSAMARGVRKEKSKLAGGIELFAISDVVIGEGRGELKVLTSSRLVHFYRHILEDYDHLQFGYEVLAQVGRASDSLDEPEWFDIVAEVLKGLDVKTVPLELTKLWFYLRIGAMLGYELNLRTDYRGKKLQPGIAYRYDMSEKGFVEAQGGDITTEHLKVLRLAASQTLSVLVNVGGLTPFLPVCLYVAREHAAL